MSLRPSDTSRAPRPADYRPADYRLRGLDLGPSPAPDPPPRTARRHPRSHRRRRRLLQWAAAALVTALVALALRAEVVEPFSVPSTSMVPTLQVGERILVVRSGLAGRITTGSIIVFHRPVGSCGRTPAPSRDLVKRVIGVAGQTVWSIGDTIYVNGGVLREAGWYNPPFGQVGPTGIRPTTIPPHDYFVMGDNRTDTCDSRAFGSIPGSSVVGKVVAVILRGGHPYVRTF